MKTQDMEAIRNELLNVREKLLHELRSKISAAAELNDEGVPDTEDLGLSDSLKEFLHLLSDREREKMLSIDDALERIEQGRYGQCERCGEAIELDRLRVQPEARSCLHCQQEIEAEQSRKTPGHGTL